MKKRLIPLAILFFLFINALFAANAEVIFEYGIDNLYAEPITIFEVNSTQYISANALIDAFQTTRFENPTVQKMVFRLNHKPFKVTADNHYIQVDEKTYQMSHPAIRQEGFIYLPLNAFVRILELENIINRYTITRGDVNELAKAVEISSIFDVFGASIEEKQNGTLLRVRTKSSYDASSVKAWLNRKTNLYITIPYGTVDKAGMENMDIPSESSIRSITVDQLGETAQLSLKVKGNVSGVDVKHNKNPSEIVFIIRHPFTIDGKHRLVQEKAKWKLDKIVLDAGHGGQDPGAKGYGNILEKDVVLDVVKRLGKLIEQRTDIEVIYTRDTDVFVPLWERTKIANEAGGKVFLSLHVNASRNKSANGYETYLLRPGKSEAAIEVTELENAVIDLENDPSHYGNLSSEQMILATMAQSSFMKESEVLAELVQLEMGKTMSGINRGVKQAGFIVLIGASMPNILLEMGFISNKNDAKKLKKAAYRQKVAESIYQGLIKYKTRHEKLMSGN
jgi:N-acetylmuramoyl-L-alanine amidase